MVSADKIQQDHHLAW